MEWYFVCDDKGKIVYVKVVVVVYELGIGMFIGRLIVKFLVDCGLYVFMF